MCLCYQSEVQLLWERFRRLDIPMPGIHKADVEKLAYNGEEAVPQLIGTLTEGAVLGDAACLNYRPLHQRLKFWKSRLVFPKGFAVLQCLTSQMLSNILLTDRKRLVAMHAELGLLQSCICSAKVCFLHGMVPRGATVRARTEVDAIAIPPSAAWHMLGSHFAYSEFWVSHLHFS